VRTDGTRAQQRLGQVDVHDEPKLVVGHADAAVRLAGQRDQRFADGIAQRVHQHVDAPKRGEDLLDGAPDLGRFRYVSDDGNDAPSGGRRDLRRRRRDVGRRQRIERDVGAGLSQHLGNPLADAASGPRNEDDLPRDIEFDRHHGVFLL
jgi:hypothetical protein